MFESFKEVPIVKAASHNSSQGSNTNKMTSVSSYPGLENKAVLITGASSGIGASTAKYFAGQKSRLCWIFPIFNLISLLYRLSLVARNLPALDLVRAECLQLGAPKVITIKCDVGVEAECEEAVNKTVLVMGGLDILVNNAGYLARENFLNVSGEDIDKSMAVNLKSAVKLSQVSLPHLQRSGGNIVNVSSIAGLRAYPGALAYKMSKAAMDQMTRCVALEVSDCFS